MSFLSLINNNPRKKFLLGLVEELTALRREVNPKYALRPSAIFPHIEAKIADYLTTTKTPLVEEDCVKLIKYFLGLPPSTAYHVTLRGLLKRDKAIKDEYFKQLENNLICPFDIAFLNFIASKIHAECHWNLPPDNHDAKVKNLTTSIEEIRASTWNKEMAETKKLIEDQVIGHLTMMKDYQEQQAELSRKAMELKAHEAKLDEETRRFHLDQILLQQTTLLRSHQAALAGREEKLKLNKQALEAEMARISGLSVKPVFTEQVRVSLEVAHAAIADIKQQQLLTANELRQMIVIETENITQKLEDFKAMQVNTNQDLKALIDGVHAELSREHVKSNKVLKDQLMALGTKLSDLDASLTYEKNLRDEEQARLTKQYKDIIKRFDAFELSAVKVDDFKALRSSHHEIILTQQAMKKKLDDLAAKTEIELTSINSRITKLESLPKTVEILSATIKNFKINVEHRLDKLEEDHEAMKVKLKEQEAQLRSMQAKLNPMVLDVIIRKQMDSYIREMKLKYTPSLESKPLLPAHFDVKLCEVFFKEQIGRGSFGAIFKAEWKEQIVAVKQIEGMITEEDRIQFIREAQFMSRMHSDYVVSFYGACFEPNNMCLLMSLMEKSSLDKVLTSLSLEVRLQMAKDLAKGLLYLHGEGITHTDIKPGNVLINSANQAKWTDFGLAKTRSTCSIKSLGTETSQAVQWQAPESWKLRDEITPASDIYSFGMLLWTLMTGRFPYVGIKDSEIITRVKAGTREVISRDIPAEIAELITACWQADPIKRPTARDVVKIMSAVNLRPASPSGDELYELGVTAHKSKRVADALAFYEKAAKKDCVKAHTSIGLMALVGEGIAEDKARAKKELEIGATGGHARAMLSLARMHEYGDGVPTDFTKALALYRQAFNASLDDPKINAKAKEKVEAFAPLFEHSR